MNYSVIKTLLIDYDKVKVEVFISYLKHLETEKDSSGNIKNKWFKYAKPEQFAALYKKVALDNLFIDGDTITLQFKGKLIVSYGYQAYKNRVLNVYPESLFDIQNVYKGDTFSFEKISGKVTYTHVMQDPFNTERELIGCYCIIKNKRGEFIETLNVQDINDMRAVAKTQAIWKAWYSEMTLKSVIKRACKRHFKDITTNIESLDNENYDLDTISIDAEVKKEIEECKTTEELQKVYKNRLNKVEDKNTFLRLLSERRIEIESEE